MTSTKTPTSMFIIVTFAHVFKPVSSKAMLDTSNGHDPLNLGPLLASCAAGVAHFQHLRHLHGFLQHCSNRPDDCFAAWREVSPSRRLLLGS